MTSSECLLWIGAWHQASSPLSEAHAETLINRIIKAPMTPPLFFGFPWLPSSQRKEAVSVQMRQKQQPARSQNGVQSFLQGQDWRANLIKPLPSSFQLKYSHGILLHPFAGRGIMLGPVLQVDLGNLWHQRIIGVRICQKRRDGEQDLGDRQSWAPLILQDV